MLLGRSSRGWWFRCVTPGCGGKRDLGRNPGRAVELLTENKLTVLPVVDKEGKLMGLISEKDVLKACKSFENTYPNFLGEKIRYQKAPQTIQLNTPIDEIGTILSAGKFRHILVVDPLGRLKGIITRRDLIRVIYFRLELNGQNNVKEI